ncbi:MAG TPA: isoprenylcysteine carboxylmethyltransferase family protein [Bradyrhizobium sp.]|jgi:protein-S-isoprenylcysteine O-methyltransferase Ste14
MIAKWLLQSLLWSAAIGVLLFVPAGTWRWPAAWVLLASMAFISIAVGLWLAKTNPGLLAERMRLTAKDEQPADDKRLVMGFGPTMLGWFVAIGIDQRLHGPDFPLPVQALGLVLLLLSTGFIVWVMHENSFAAPLVKVQTERGHHVVNTGPYAWVRHPMYSGAILFAVGIPLLLGSVWGLVLSPLFAAIFVIRIGIEERTLTAGLPGYGDYTSQVRYRLLPGVW